MSSPPVISLLLLLLALQATLTHAAKLQFRGLQSFTPKKLIEQIGGRLEFIRKRPATSFRADDAAFLVESFLHKHGLPDASVSWNLAPNDTIILTVNEGRAQFLGPLTTNLPEPPPDFLTQFQAAFPTSGSQRAYQANLLPTATERATQSLQSQGFWDAQVRATPQPRLPDGQIPVRLELTPGPQYTLTSPVLISPIPPSPKLQARLLSTVGQIATAERIFAVRKSVESYYQSLGYLNLALEMSQETKGSQMRLSFQITPGTQKSVRNLTLIQDPKNQKTKRTRIQKRFTPFIGQSFNEKALNAEIKKLLSTGAFDSIRLSTTPASPTELDLTLHLSEAKARGYSFAAGFGSIEGFILGARYYDHNLWGSLHQFNLGTEITGLGILGDTTLTNPFFLERNLALTHRAFLLTRDFDSYRKFQGGLSSTLSWKLGDHYSASLGLELSHSNLTSPIPSSLTGPKDYLLNRLDFRQTYDHRNDPTLPSKGWLAALDTSLGLAASNQSVGFFESKAQLTYYHPFNDQQNLALNLRGGFIANTSDQDTLPIDLRTFLGGANTIRSFPERELGRSFNRRPLGGTQWWLANAEYQHALIGPVKGLAFLDYGALDSQIELALGLGLRIDLPVGPIRLEYGHNLTQDPGEPNGTFHFAIGTTF